MSKVGRTIAVATIGIWSSALAAGFTTVAHILYVDRFEFATATREWNVAHDLHDRAGERTAFKKEIIAHCRTFDILWMLHRHDYCANLYMEGSNNGKD